MSDFTQLLSSTLVSSLSLWRGTNATPAAVKPLQPLELYDMEGCPFCRLVREAMTELDLEALIYPCPKGGKRFRPRVKKLGGKMQLPFLVDPNTETKLYESQAIITYLFKTYGQRELPLKWRAETLNKMTSALASLARYGSGLRARPAKLAKQPLELYSFESSPYSRPVRELLCELELPYLLHNVGKDEVADFILPNLRQAWLPQHGYKGRSRQAMAKRAGKVMVPYLIDANTKAAMFESKMILAYLQMTYGK